MKISDYHGQLMIPRYLTATADWHGHIPFAYFLVQLTLPKTIVELGVCAGDSLFSFAQICAVLRRGKPDYRPVIHGVDTWEGDENCVYPGDIFYDGVKRAIAPFSEWVVLHRTRTDAAVSSFADASIDLLHIDADHTYEGVKADFEGYFSKLSHHACILFHDTADIVSARTGKKVDGVQRLWNEEIVTSPTYVGKFINFPHCNGLGVLFPNEFPNAETQQFIQEETPEQTYEYFGLLAQHMNYFAKEIIL